MEKEEQMTEKPKNPQEFDIIDYRDFLRSELKAMTYVIREANHYPTEIEEKNSEERVEEAHRLNQILIKEKVAKMMLYERKLEIVAEVLNIKKEDKFQSEEYKHIEKFVEKTIETEKFQPTEQDIMKRIDTIIETDSNWTDATQSVNEDDDDQIWVVDDAVMDAMDIDSGEEQIKEEDEDDDSQQGEDGEGKKHKKKRVVEQEINLEELEEQFVKGGESDHYALFGQHNKFCVSVNGSKSRGILVSGSGDDYLFFFKAGDILKQAENLPSKDEVIKPIHSVKHTETINKICLSSDEQFVFSLTDNEALWTDLETLKTMPLPVESISDICTHPSGGAIAISTGFDVHLYSVKKLTHYSSYYLDTQVSMIDFAANGKQIVAVCGNKLRIITPKTEEVAKISGPLSHVGEITAMAIEGNTVLTGDLDGFICATSLSNMSIVARAQKNTTIVNHLLFAQNFFMCGCAEDYMSWYDTNKMKKIFQNQLNGAPTGFIALDDGICYGVGTLKGFLYIYDRRQPLQPKQTFKTGSTVHSMWNQGDIMVAGCQDGLVKVFDRKMVKP